MKMSDQMKPVVEEMLRGGYGYDEAAKHFRAAYILEVMRQVRGNQCKAAAVLGVHRNTLSRHLLECGITTDQLVALRRNCGCRPHRKPAMPVLRFDAPAAALGRLA